MLEKLREDISCGQWYAVSALKKQTESLQEAANTIDSRAALLTGISATIAGAIVAADLLPEAQGAGVFAKVLHLVAGLAAIGVIYNASKIWAGRRNAVIGNPLSFWERFVQAPTEPEFVSAATEYDAEVSRTFSCVFIDYEDAVRSLLSVNDERAKMLQQAFRYLHVQVVAIAVSLTGPWVDAAATAFWAWVCGPAN